MGDEEKAKENKRIDISCIRCNRSIWLYKNAEGTKVWGTCPICKTDYSVDVSHMPFK